ncbi:unnamed protein product [Schistosoma curassoni]|uniref:Ovule protein n=1 Tax=Schistosoma curassoni TaxID=6186 RepID=A0A183L781_9TREM|nr:unnamed protein product [Schistosoma curassoni]
MCIGPGCHTASVQQDEHRIHSSGWVKGGELTPPDSPPGAECLPQLFSGELHPTLEHYGIKSSIGKRIFCVCIFSMKYMMFNVCVCVYVCVCVALILVSTKPMSEV